MMYVCVCLMYVCVCVSDVCVCVSPFPCSPVHLSLSPELSLSLSLSISLSSSLPLFLSRSLYPTLSRSHCLPLPFLTSCTHTLLPPRVSVCVCIHTLLFLVPCPPPLKHTYTHTYHGDEILSKELSPPVVSAQENAHGQEKHVGHTMVHSHRHKRCYQRPQCHLE